MCRFFLLTFFGLLLSPVQKGEVAGQAPAPGISPDSLEIIKAQFLEEEGFRQYNADSLSAGILDRFESPYPSIFRADASVTPPGKSLLALETMDGTASHARYRIRFLTINAAVSPAGGPVPFTFIQADRLNLGQRMYDELKAVYEEGHLAPKKRFRPGRHVTWRLVTRPVMGQAAAIIGAARAEISEQEAGRMECFGRRCTRTDGIIAAHQEWEVRRTENSIFSKSVADTILATVPEPAVVVELVLAEAGAASVSGGHYYWKGLGGKPFTETNPDGVDTKIFFEVSMLVEKGLGQDSVLDGAVICHKKEQERCTKTGYRISLASGFENGWGHRAAYRKSLFCRTH